MLASQMIQCNMLQKSNQGIVAGGMESMSNIPHYLKQFRQGSALGHSEILDGVIHDGLWDVYNDQHMGMCAEKCATDYDIGREEQDAYAVMSYQRAQGAIAAGMFKDEIEAVDVSHGKGKTSTISEDEEPTSASMGKFARLRPAFKKENGTVTAANASSLNDGAAAMVLMSEDAALELGLKPLARILGFGDAEQDPVDFTTAPSLAVPRALAASGVQLSDIEFHEINEAFSVVVSSSNFIRFCQFDVNCLNNHFIKALANMKILDLDQARVNVFGGAVALGHPIGMSGARIIGNLYNVLKTKNASLGCASICNGGGGASAIVIERTQ
jgi:acetyl-CoA C-acetyltransferase